MKRSSTCRSTLASTLAVALLAAAPAAAQASTVSVSGGTLTVSASPGETNDVRIDNNFLNGVSVIVTDQAGVTPGLGCVAESATEVECDRGGAVSVDLGDGSDQLNVGFVDGVVTVSAGPGNDQVDGLYDRAVVDGGDGDDLLNGGTGNDQLAGGAGNDAVEGKGGNDVVDGGPGTDTLVGDSSRSATGEGNDTIMARDGMQDQVSCGLGADAVTADGVDVVDPVLCDVVDRGPQGGAGGGSGGGRSDDGGSTGPGNATPVRAPAKCAKLAGTKRKTCVKRKRAIAKCKAIKAKTRKAKRRKAACMRKAKRIGKPTRKRV